MELNSYRKLSLKIIFFGIILFLVVISCNRNNIQVKNLDARFATSDSVDNFLIDVYHTSGKSYFEVKDSKGKMVCNFKSGYFVNSRDTKPFVVYDDNIFFYTQDKELICTSLKNGKKKWAYLFEEGSSYLLPNNFFIYKDCLVFLISKNNLIEINCFNIQSGILIYKKTLEDSSINPLIYPKIINGYLFMGYENYKLLDIKGGNLIELSESFNSTLTMSSYIFSEDKQFLYAFNINGTIIKLDFSNLTNQSKEIPVDCIKIPKIITKDFDFVSRYNKSFIFWSKGTIRIFNLETREIKEIFFEKNYRKSNNLIVYKSKDYNYYNIKDNIIPFVAQNDDGGIKLYALDMYKDTIKEFELPSTIKENKILAVNSFCSNNIYYFDLNVQNEFRHEYDVLITFNSEKYKLLNVVEFYKKNGVNHSSWQVLNGKIYGFYKNDGIVKYYTIDVDKSQIYNTNLSEDEFSIISF